MNLRNQYSSLAGIPAYISLVPGNLPSAHPLCNIPPRLLVRGRDGMPETEPNGFAWDSPVLHKSAQGVAIFKSTNMPLISEEGWKCPNRSVVDTRVQAESKAPASCFGQSTHHLGVGTLKTSPFIIHPLAQPSQFMLAPAEA